MAPSTIRASAAAGEAGADRSKGKVLEVSQVFGDAILGVRHFSKGAKVRVGSGVVTTLKFFGTKIAEVPEAVAPLIPFVTLSLGTTEESWKNPFYVPAEFLPRNDYLLFENNGGVWGCNIAEQWAGFVDQGETRRTFQELIASGQAQKSPAGGYRIEIPEDGRLVVDLGNTIFVAHQVYPGKRAIVPFGDSIDYPFIPFPGKGRDRPPRATLSPQQLRAILRACEEDIAAMRAARESAARLRVSEGDKPGTLGWVLTQIEERYGGIIPDRYTIEHKGNFWLQQIGRAHV